MIFWTDFKEYAYNVHVYHSKSHFKFVQKKLGKKNNKLDTLQASLKEHSIKISVD